MKIKPHTLEALVELAARYLLPARGGLMTGPRARYLERIGLAEYGEHVDHWRRGRVTMIKGYQPTRDGLVLVACRSGDQELAAAALAEIEAIDRRQEAIRTAPLQHLSTADE